MLAQALLGVEKTDRLDTVRLYGLHLAVVGPRLACLRVHAAVKAPRVWRPFQQQVRRSYRWRPGACSPSLGDGRDDERCKGVQAAQNCRKAKLMKFYEHK
jgi:hypothetical protein